MVLDEHLKHANNADMLRVLESAVQDSLQEDFLLVEVPESVTSVKLKGCVINWLPVYEFDD